MNIILLSGGSGKRLWPLSNDVRSKQFIKLFKDGDKYESMVQRNEAALVVRKVCMTALADGGKALHAKAILFRVEFPNGSHQRVGKANPLLAALDGKTDDWWWLRSARSIVDYSFYNVYYYGGWSYDSATDTYGVSPAFRIG